MQAAWEPGDWELIPCVPPCEAPEHDLRLSCYGKMGSAWTLLRSFYLSSRRNGLHPTWRQMLISSIYLKVNFPCKGLFPWTEEGRLVCSVSCPAWLLATELSNFRNHRDEMSRQRMKWLKADWAESLTYSVIPCMILNISTFISPSLKQRR